jgi:hypothetical protein
LTVENSIRSYWSKIKIRRAFCSTTEMLCLRCSSAEAWSPICTGTLSSPGDAGQYLHSHIHCLTPGIYEERNITEQMSDARARNLRAVDAHDHVTLCSELSGYFPSSVQSVKIEATSYTPYLPPSHIISSFCAEIFILQLLLISCILKIHLRPVQAAGNASSPLLRSQKTNIHQIPFIHILSVRNADENT